MKEERTELDINRIMKQLGIQPWEGGHNDAFAKSLLDASPSPEELAASSARPARERRQEHPNPLNSFARSRSAKFLGNR